ncbi:MAG: cobalamin B12-binding domain-containing protein [Panacagrimonas sp.]
MGRKILYEAITRSKSRQAMGYDPDAIRDFRAWVQRRCCYRVLIWEENQMMGMTQDRVTRLDVKRDSVRRLRAGPGGVLEAPATPASATTILDFRQNSGVLVRTVQREVIPRLMVAYRPGSARRLPAEEVVLPERVDVVEFTGLIATCDLTAARSLIEVKRTQGMSLETLYLHLLIPAARRLSDLWEADLCHYEEIAVGMLHLQQMLHELSPGFSSEVQCRLRGRKALLVSAPAEQNMLGVFMVSEFCRCVTTEFFHRAGWEVWRTPPSSRAKMLDVIHSHWFDVIDVSASCEGRLPTLSADIAEMRKVSRNRQVGVMVGGPVFSDHPEFKVRVGADASAFDARDTLLQAESLVERREREKTHPYY